VRQVGSLNADDGRKLHLWPSSSPAGEDELLFFLKQSNWPTTCPEVLLTFAFDSPTVAEAGIPNRGDLNDAD
jgi:hypothetical protein